MQSEIYMQRHDWRVNLSKCMNVSLHNPSASAKRMGFILGACLYMRTCEHYILRYEPRGLSRDPFCREQC